jgi:nucleoside-diphosphate-sugar epimerase
MGLNIQFTGNPCGMSDRLQHPVLVTGASGFIGRHLVHRLIERGCRVSCLVRVSSRTDELRSVDARLVTGDVTDRADMTRVMAESQPRIVFHLAGLLKVLHSDDFLRVNAGGAESVAAACADCPEPPVLVMTSSLAAAGPCADGRPHEESDSPTPVSAYGRSKLAAERAVVRYAGRVPITIVRPPIVFGSEDRGVLEMFRPIARWGLHVVPGRSRRRFSLIHVADLVEGLLLAAEKGERLTPNGSPGQGVYFLATDDHPTYAQLGEAIGKALGKKRVTVINLPALLMRCIGLCGDAMSRIRRRPVWINSDKMTEALAGSWMCSSAKARADLGWHPAATLAARFLETVQGYRQAGWL